MKDKLIQAYRQGDSRALRDIARRINQLDHRAAQMAAHAGGAVPAVVASNGPTEAARAIVVQQPQQVVRKVVRNATDEERRHHALAAARAELELEAMRIDLDLKRAQLLSLQQEQFLAAQRAQVLQSDMENRAVMSSVADALQAASSKITQSVEQMAGSVETLTAKQVEAAKAAAAAIEKPRRIVRENGRIVGLEVVNGGR